MEWLRNFFARNRETEAQRLLGTLFDKYGLEVAPEFPDFIDWLDSVPLHESAKVLAKVLGNDPNFPRTGPYSSIRAYFDDCLRGEPELEEIGGQLAYTWMAQKAAHKKVRVRDG